MLWLQEAATKRSVLTRTGRWPHEVALAEDHPSPAAWSRCARSSRARLREDVDLDSLTREVLDVVDQTLSGLRRPVRGGRSRARSAAP